jgi:hypothetical protein
MKPSYCQHALILGLFACCLASDAQAQSTSISISQTGVITQGSQNPVASRFSQGYCRAGTMPICGIQFNMPQSYPGLTTKLDLPARFANDSLSVQCIVDRTGANYQVIGDLKSLCALKPCKPAAVNVCNALIPVEIESALGTEHKVTIPASFLSGSRKSVLSTFNVKCSIDSEIPHYEVTNTSGVSCNDFPCEPTVLRICNNSVRISSYAELGQVIQTQTDKQQPVTVQCLGSGGNRPVYQITDRSQAVCK